MEPVSIKKCPQCQMDVSTLAKICPHCRSKLKRTTSTFMKVLLILLSIGIFGPLMMSGLNGPSHNQNQTPAISATAQVDTTSMVFDIPKLIGKSIKQVETILGPAAHSFEPTALQQRTGIIDADKTFDIDGVSLMVTYNSQTGIIKEYFLETPDPSGATANTSSLLKLGNLVSGAADYRINFVPTIKDPGVYTGVVITPI